MSRFSWTDHFQKPEPFSTRDVDAPWRYEPSDRITGALMKEPPKTIRAGALEPGPRHRDGRALPRLHPALPAGTSSTPLVAAGVDNLQAFPAVLNRPDGRKVTDDKAVNILGLVRCADLGKSQYPDIRGMGMVAVAFRKLGHALFFAISLCVAAAAAVSGRVGFVGLIVPHLLRLWLGPDQRLLLPASAAGGALFLELADLSARLLFQPLGTSAPVGVLTALIGGPTVLWTCGDRAGNWRE